MKNNFPSEIGNRFYVDGFQRTVNATDRTVEGYIMTPAKTVDGRRIDKDAFNHSTALTEFLNNPQFLFNHDTYMPIGVPKKLEARNKKGIYGIGRVDEESMWNWVLQGRVRGFSVGVKVLDWDVEEDKDLTDEEKEATFWPYIMVLLKAELFDMSIVTSPANTYCLFVESNTGNTPEITGFPEQLRKSVEGQPLEIPETFQRVALSSGLPLYLPEQDNFEMYVPFARNDTASKEALQRKLAAAGLAWSEEDWWLYGYATKFDEVDTYKTRMSRGAVEKALPAYREWGTVREQHDRFKAVGTAPLLEIDDQGLFVATKISKGAPDTWEKVQDGTLKGFSLGGVIKDSLEVILAGQKIRDITAIDLAEVSIVDRPAVRSCGFVLACREENSLATLPAPEEPGSKEQFRQAMAQALEGQEVVTMTTGSLDPENLKATSYGNLPLNKERSWDSSAAIKRVKSWAGAEEKPNAKFRRAFFWYDSAEPDLFGSYKLPFADVIDGTLTAIWRGCTAAMGALKGARGGVNIPDDDRRPVYNHISKYYRKAGEEPPDFDTLYDEEKLMGQEQEPVTTETEIVPTPAPVETPPATPAPTPAEKWEEKLDRIIALLEAQATLPEPPAATPPGESTPPATSTPEPETLIRAEEVATLQQQVEEQSQLLRAMSDRLKITTEGQRTSGEETTPSSSKWSGVVPPLSRLRRKVIAP